MYQYRTRYRGKKGRMNMVNTRQKVILNERTKTISTRLKVQDADLLQQLCDQYKMTPSEALRLMITALIKPKQKENSAPFMTAAEENILTSFSCSMADLKQMQIQAESELFYKHFRKMNDKTKSMPPTHTLK